MEPIPLLDGELLDENKAFADAINRAETYGKLSGMKSENGTKPNKQVNIISTPLYDPYNRWKEFLCVEKIDPEAIIPTKESEFAAGYDLYAFEAQSIPAWGKICAKLKIRIHLPPGTYGRIAARSGLSLKHDIEVGAGVIDADYQGEVGVVLRNFSDNGYSK
jgi:deoxycytidine triphosphate deaminase